MPRSESNNIRCNALSVDVEDYFQVSAFETRIGREHWGDWPVRVEVNTQRVLALFADAGVQATFFTLGWVARRFPGLLRQMVEQGHEVASHGMHHVRVHQQTREEFAADVAEAKALLEDISGAEVTGYRAASYSINRDNWWALDVLRETGYRYSSSIYPIRHDLYGVPDAPRFPFDVDGLKEIPITTVRIAGQNFPCGGGGFFRLYPYALSRWALRYVNEREHESAVFYFHPWELDVDQPRVAGIGAGARLRHYVNLSRMEERLRRLLSDFRWGRMDHVYGIGQK